MTHRERNSEFGFRISELPHAPILGMAARAEEERIY